MCVRCIHTNQNTNGTHEILKIVLYLPQSVFRFLVKILLLILLLDLFAHLIYNSSCPFDDKILGLSDSWIIKFSVKQFRSQEEILLKFLQHYIYLIFLADFEILEYIFKNEWITIIFFLICKFYYIFKYLLKCWNI